MPHWGVEFLLCKSARVIDLPRFGGHGLQSLFDRIMYCSKPGNSNHMKNLFEMVVYAGDAGELFIFIRFGEELNECRDAAAVNIGVFLKF